MELKNTITYLFSEVTNLFRTYFEKHLLEIGLHSGQIFILLMLLEKDGRNQVEIAAQLNNSAPTINTMVKSLLNNGFVETRACKTDARMVRVYLTQKTRDLESVIFAKWMDFDETFFQTLTATERLMLFQMLEKIKLDLVK